MEFDFKAQPEEVEWLVENLLPSSHLCLFLAQAGIGKSLVVESLAVHVVFGMPFAGLKTVEGNVLLIDQDTPENVLDKRLLQFGNAMKTERKHKLFKLSMENLTLSSKTLLNRINDYPSVSLVIIDCLHSVCGKLNPNHTSDMGVLAQLKSECLTDKRTIILNHHISEKSERTVESLMIEDTHSLAMGNSAIIQQADSYYVIGATANNGITNKIYIRPVSKRVSIPTKPIILQTVKPDSDSESMEYVGIYEPDIDDVEADILALFREMPSDRTVKEVYETTGHRHGENKIRTALEKLEGKGLMVMNRHRHNQFKYRLP